MTGVCILGTYVRLNGSSKCRTVESTLASVASSVNISSLSCASHVEIRKRSGWEGRCPDGGASTASRDDARQVAGKAGVELAQETSECHLLVVTIEATGDRRRVLIGPGCYIRKYHRLITDIYFSRPWRLGV